MIQPRGETQSSKLAAEMRREVIEILHLRSQRSKVALQPRNAIWFAGRSNDMRGDCIRA